MKVNKGKALAILILFMMIAQVCLPVFQNTSFAIGSSSSQEWDISSSGNGSVIAKIDEKGTLTIYGAGSMNNWNNEAGLTAPWYEMRNNIINISIAEGITTVGKNAFSECTSLENIELPKSLMSIGSYAFSDCTALRTAEIPSQVTSLGEGAFSRCISLESVMISNALSKIGNQTFDGCTSLESIIIPDGIKEIGYFAFKDCTVLNKVIIPSGVSNIHAQAFEGCNSIKIICTENSIAETYAKEKNIECVADNEKPRIEFTASEADNSLQKANITVKVADNIAGINENSLKYTWSTKLTDVQFEEISTSFKNGETIQNQTLTGAHYLWVAASDLLGNYIVQNSTACDFDNTLPTITASQSDSQITITVAELGMGLSETNSYQYYVSTNDTMLIEGEWKNYVSGEPIVIEQGRTENYYLFIRTISDKAGNTSASNGTMVTIDAEVYHRFGPYTREIEKVAFTPNGTQSWESNVEVEISKLGNNLNGNYKYAWVEESKDINVGDSAEELEGIEFAQDNMVANNKGTEDGKYNLVIIETFTNQIIAKSNVFNFTTDIVAPTVKVLYSTTDTTNKNVTVTVVASEEIQEIEGWQLSEDRRQLSREYETNTDEIITVNDLVGNETEQPITILNIDKVTPVSRVEYSITEMTNQNVVVTINSDKELQELDGWKLSEDKKQLTKEYEQNNNKTVILKDLMGNRTEQPINVSNIDKEPATLEVKYATIEKTNQSSKVIIIAREELQPLDGWELSGDKRQLIKHYTENVEETIIVRDLAGNETEQVIEISNIDKTSAFLNVNYSTTEITSQNVIVTITSNEELQGLNGWTLSEDKFNLTKEYTNNTSVEGEKLVLRDLAGNETEQLITISNIDKTAPVIKMIYSTLKPTDQNVTVIILGNEQMQSIEGWELSEDKLQLTKIYEENHEEVVILKDIFGNQTEKSINISNIDKNPTVVDVSYSTIELTNSNVITTITSNKELQELEGWKLSEDKTKLVKEYTQNTEEKVIVKDVIGNEIEKEINITNIDKKAPSLKVVYSIKKTRNPKVTVIVISDEPIQPISGWELSEDNKQLTKIYEATQEEKVVVKDLVGNQIEETIEVMCEKPEIIKGDLNGDGKIDLADMLIVNKARLGKRELTEEEAIVADITEDGKVDFKDIMKINKLRLNKDAE